MAAGLKLAVPSGFRVRAASHPKRADRAPCSTGAPLPFCSTRAYDDLPPLTVDTTPTQAHKAHCLLSESTPRPNSRRISQQPRPVHVPDHGNAVFHALRIVNSQLQPYTLTMQPAWTPGTPQKHPGGRSQGGDSPVPVYKPSIPTYSKHSKR